MRAASEQADLQTIGGRGNRSGAAGDGAGGTDHDVLAKHDIGRGEAFEQAVVDHRLGALGGFLARLEHGHQRALPGIALLRQQRRRTDQPGDCMSWPHISFSSTARSPTCSAIHDPT